MNFQIRVAVAPAVKLLADSIRLEIGAGLKTGDFACIIMQSRRDFLTTLAAAGAAAPQPWR
jgi:hypothetical protein